MAGMRLSGYFSEKKKKKLRLISIVGLLVTITHKRKHDFEFALDLNLLAVLKLGKKSVICQIFVFFIQSIAASTYIYFLHAVKL